APIRIVAARACASDHTLPLGKRPAIESANRIDNLIKTDRVLRAGRQPHGRLRFDGARIRRPGREDRAFFFGRKVEVTDHGFGTVECRRRVEKGAQLRVGDVRQRCKRNAPHTKPPSLSFCQYAASANKMENRAATANSSPIIVAAAKQLLLLPEKLEK